MSGQITSKPAAKLVAAWQTIVRSVAPRTPAEAAIVDDEIRLTRGSSDTADLLLPVAAIFVALACREWVALPTLVIWTLSVTLTSAGVWLLGHRIEPWRHEGVEGIRKWAQMRTAMTAVFLAVWCSMGIFLWSPESVRDHMFLILVLSASLAATNVMVAAHPATALTALLIHSAVLIFRPLLAGDSLDLTVAGLAAIFCLLMASQARVVYRTARRARELQFEREYLIRDLSEAKKESDRERERATDAGRTRSEFLANMNHELRTPMNAILGFSELIKNRAYGNRVEKYTEYAGIIHDSGQHLLALINDMLDLAKIEGGKLSLRESRFSLSHLISELTGEYESAASEHGIAVSVQIETGLPQIHADERALRQIMTNLLSNAVKFTLSGGTVTAFAYRAMDGRCAFGVADTGIGIATEAQHHVFERFGRGRHDVTNSDKGTGLGLAIVKGFAEAHDGEVELESEIGAGTRVTVFLPAGRWMPTPQKAAS